MEFSLQKMIRVFELREMRWTRREVRIREMRNAYKILVGKPEEKSPLETPRTMRECNVKMDLKEMKCEVMEWVRVGQDKVY
jgi:hypothetical protein